MDNVKQTGKILRKVANESGHNSRRMAENFELPERKVGVFNRLHSYKTSFTMGNGSVAKLNLKITPLTIPCTINPPTVDVKAAISFEGDNPGEFTTNVAPVITSNLDPPNPDYTWTAEGIVVPVDGCYSVLWESSSWGVAFFGDKHITVALTHNGFVFREVVHGSTGATSIFQIIYSYAPASPIYAVIECKAGDVISAYMTQNSTSEGLPWLGQPEGLRGFFASSDNYASLITVELIAVAEDG